MGVALILTDKNGSVVKNCYFETLYEEPNEVKNEVTNEETGN